MAGAETPLALVPLNSDRDLSVVFRVDTAGARYVLKRYAPGWQGVAAQSEMRFAQLAAAAGFNRLAKPITASPESEAGVWVLYDYVPGSLASERWTAACWQAAGELLASYHAATARILDNHGRSISSGLCGTAFDPSLHDEVVGPWVIAHGDYRADNLIASSSGLTMIDFEFRKLAPVTYDLATMLAYRSRGGAFDIASIADIRSLVDGYIGATRNPERLAGTVTVRSVARAGVAIYDLFGRGLQKGDNALATACHVASASIAAHLV